MGAVSTVATWIAIYFIIWWTTLFAVLPLGMNQGHRERPTDGSDWGAPETPNLKKKFITTTWVAAIIFAVVMAIIHFNLIPLPDIPSNY